ncbi:MAG: hypothetical protein AAF740_12115, partial [Bacteroidota bacterium]
RYNVCVRIDGFLSPNGDITLIDSNTIPGMSPTSLIFRQVAEIGLDPTRYLTFMIYRSLQERLSSGKRPYRLRELLHNLRQKLEDKQESNKTKAKRIILIPSYGDLKVIALREARHIYTQLAANQGTLPYLVFVKQTSQKSYEVYRISVSYLLQPSLEAISKRLEKPEHPILGDTRERAASITSQFSPDFVPLPQKLNPEELRELSESVYMPVADNSLLSITLRKDLENAGMTYYEA